MQWIRNLSQAILHRPSPSPLPRASCKATAHSTSQTVPAPSWCRFSGIPPCFGRSSVRPRQPLWAGKFHPPRHLHRPLRACDLNPQFTGSLTPQPEFLLPKANGAPSNASLSSPGPRQRGHPHQGTFIRRGPRHLPTVGRGGPEHPILRNSTSTQRNGAHGKRQRPSTARSLFGPTAHQLTGPTPFAEIWPHLPVQFALAFPKPGCTNSSCQASMQTHDLPRRPTLPNRTKLPFHPWSARCSLSPSGSTELAPRGTRYRKTARHFTAHLPLDLGKHSSLK